MRKRAKRAQAAVLSRRRHVLRAQPTRVAGCDSKARRGDEVDRVGQTLGVALGTRALADYGNARR